MEQPTAQRRLLAPALFSLALAAASCTSAFRGVGHTVESAEPASAGETPAAPLPDSQAASPLEGVADAAIGAPPAVLLETSEARSQVPPEPIDLADPPSAVPPVALDQNVEPASIDELLALSELAGLPAEETAELKDAVTADPQMPAHDVPIPLNKKVLSYIALFQGRLHDFIQEGLTRGAAYRPMIQRALRAEGLPLDLAYVPLVESAFKPNALSRARAKGVWQFVRGTGLEHGLRQDWYVDERSDPEKSTAAAARYLSTLSTMFNGDWYLALASYNGGPGRVQRAIKRGKSSDFWTLAAKRGILPRETREYVPMILAAMVISRNPGQYGFAVGLESEAPLAYDLVTMSVPVDLRLVAEWAGTTLEVIKGLNPELRRWTTPVRDTEYELKVPAGSAVLVSARLAEAPLADLATLDSYTVKRGETLTTIARKLRVTRADLAEANYLRSTSRVAIGQELLVPREPRTTGERAPRLLAAANAPAVTDAVLAAPPGDTVVPAVAVPASPPVRADLVRTVYRIKSGDTLTSIARAHGTTVAALKRWNGISGTRIRAGDRLTIFTARAND